MKKLLKIFLVLLAISATFNFIGTCVVFMSKSEIIAYDVMILLVDFVVSASCIWLAVWNARRNKR